jgi:aspartyl-tRNA synthetase
MPELQKNIIMRHKVVKLVRDYLDENGFIEIETPVLAKVLLKGKRLFGAKQSESWKILCFATKSTII